MSTKQLPRLPKICNAQPLSAFMRLERSASSVEAGGHASEQNDDNGDAIAEAVQLASVLTEPAPKISHDSDPDEASFAAAATSEAFDGQSFGPPEIPEEPSLPTAMSDTEFAVDVLGSRDLEDDVRHAAMWRDGRGLFTTWEDKLEALKAAFVVLLHLQASGSAAINEMMRHPPFKGTKRTASRTNLAVLAVRLVAKPKEVSEHKSASDYAAVLTWAIIERITPDDFVRRADSMTLRTCREFVREHVGKVKPAQAATQVPATGGRYHGAVSMVVSFSDGSRKTVVLSLEPHLEEALRSLPEQKTALDAAVFIEAMRRASA